MHPMLAKAEAQLRLELQAADYITHPGENGRAREEAVRRFLRIIVPPAFGIDTGFVTDVHGSVSCQVDIVIYRLHYHPVFEIAGVKHFMVESVAAVIENKASIKSREVFEKAFNNIVSIKKLDRTGGGNNRFVMDFHGGGKLITPNNPQHQIFGAIIAQESLSEETLLSEWQSHCSNHSVHHYPNTYVDLDEFVLLYLNAEQKICLYPEQANSFATTAPHIMGNRPLLDFVHLLANQLRTAGTIDYDVTRYFPLSSVHHANSRRFLQPQTNYSLERNGD
jgi:hypothetical protein